MAKPPFPFFYSGFRTMTVASETSSQRLVPELYCRDFGVSFAFYRDVLGFIIGEEWRERGVLMGVEMQAGAVTFMLSQDDFAKGRDRQKGVGTRFYCGTAQDIDRFAAQIRERGGVLDQEPKDMPWGARVFMISDPDGFKLTFQQER